MTDDELENAPSCENCGSRYLLLPTCALIPNGFLIYNPTTLADEWDADVCEKQDCPHNKAQKERRKAAHDLAAYGTGVTYTNAQGCVRHIPLRDLDPDDLA